MRALFAAVMTALALAFVVTDVSTAEMYFSKSEAKGIAIDLGHEEYGIARWRISAICDPLGAKWRPGYQYRRWQCIWGTTTKCYGFWRIYGNRRGSGWYSYVEAPKRFRCRR